jgi:excinuclease UvrABC ATPase subunit
MNDETLLLTHARRYFRAAAECQDLRKMEVLVDLGCDYLRLAARRNGSGGSPDRLKSGNSADMPTSDAGVDS